MSMLESWLIPILWLGFWVYWGLRSRGVKSTQKVESAPSQLAHFVPLGVAIYIVIWQPFFGEVLNRGYMPQRLAMPFFVAGCLLTVAGLAFAVWARVHIGRNWSATVTVKQEHELIRSGPYRFVRHPIYSGLLLATVGSALAHGSWIGLAAIAIAFASLWRKLRLEERWMGEVFGDAYARYRSEVAALIPLLL